ncbi:MAG: hypothetical protein WC107_07395 [Patescibacteria group bacterium]
MTTFKNEYATLRIRRRGAMDEQTWYVVERYDETHDAWHLDSKHRQLRCANYAARRALLNAEEYEEVRRGGHPLPRKYTVVLSLPDYMTDGQARYFTTCVPAKTPKQALAAARKEAVLEIAGFGLTPEDAGEGAKTNPLDFASVAVFEGDHNNINPEN